MLRVSLEYLSKENENCYYKGNLYTGLVIDVDAGRVVSLDLFEEGQRSTEYTNEYWEVYDYKLRVEDSQLSFEYNDNQNITSYNNEAFTGIAFKFENEFCTAESLYIDGQLSSELTFYKNGQIADISFNRDGIDFDCSWYQNGSMHKMEIFKLDLFDISLEFTEENNLTNLKIEGDYFNNIEQFKDIIKEPFFYDKSFFKDVDVTEDITITGKHVDDIIFENLFSNQGMHKLKKILLFDTSITDKHLPKLESLDHFEAVIINGIRINSKMVEENNASLRTIGALILCLLTSFYLIPRIFGEVSSYDRDHAGALTIVLFSAFVISSGIIYNVNKMASIIFTVIGILISDSIFIYILVCTRGSGDVLNMMVVVNAVSLVIPIAIHKLMETKDSRI
ncbi:MAG: hypothetical protein GY714_33075 [Desulfobacterales bacterium]|nr:hypothetical protein [Desulfobacterales bacterium]